MIEPLQVERAHTQIIELEAICRLRPTSTLLGELAACYFTVGNSEKALPLAQLAWNKNRNSAIGTNLGLILKDLGRHDESVSVLEESFHINPDDAYLRMGYSEGLLKAGHWSKAWPIYDNSRLTQQGAAWTLQLPASVQEWQGEDLSPDHRLFVINEGGHGDRMSYARWLPELTRRGLHWKFYPFEELFSFFERIFPREDLVKDGEVLVPDPTHWTTTFALPAKLGVGPKQVPPPLKFTARPEAIEKFKIGRPDNLPVMGICYEAAEKFQGGRTVRSMTEGEAMRLVCMTGDRVHWVSLQYGKKMPHPVINVPAIAEGKATWEDTAGLIHNLDAVVSVDTAIMHLAGSMGKPMSVLLSGNSCWKFLRRGEKCVWYPTATLIRNEGQGFENAIDKLIARIRS